MWIDIKEDYKQIQIDYSLQEDHKQMQIQTAPVRVLQ